MPALEVVRCNNAQLGFTIEFLWNVLVVILESVDLFVAKVSWELVSGKGGALFPQALWCSVVVMMVESRSHV